MIDEKKLSKDICHYLFERLANTSIFKLSGKRIEQVTKMRNDIIDIINAQPKTDWIPCEERLPENLEQVLVWYEYFRYGDYNCMYQTYGIGYHLDGFWSGDVSGHKARCIAWQPLPLPQPYREDKLCK